MSRKMRVIELLPLTALAVCLSGCDKPSETAGAKSSAAATVATPPSKTSTATPSAAVKKPSHPCPEGSKGEGTRKSPCKAKGATRIMDVKWTRKSDDKGPKFKVTSKSKLPILYGQLIVYFYDSSGKQLEVAGGGEARSKLPCIGNIFAGAMKPGEKAFMTFSCLKKKHVPEGTAAIEGELQMVGFTDEMGKKSDTFWRNDDLVPDERPKGGIK